MWWFFGASVVLAAILLAFVAGIVLARRERLMGIDDPLARAIAMINAEITTLEKDHEKFEVHMSDLLRKIDKESRLRQTASGQAGQGDHSGELQLQQPPTAQPPFLSRVFGSTDAQLLLQGLSGVAVRLERHRNRREQLARWVKALSQHVNSAPTPKANRGGSMTSTEAARTSDKPAPTYVNELAFQRALQIRSSGASYTEPLKAEVIEREETRPDPAPTHVKSEWFSKPTPTPSGGPQQIVDLYNDAIDDRAAGDEFRDRFQPVRIGTANAVERRQNATLSARFTEAPDGDFFAIPGAPAGQYWVVPRLGLTIEAVNYGAGAVGKVFGGTRAPNPSLHYSRYRVEAPAVFRRDGEQWTLCQPGRLDLGPGA